MTVLRALLLCVPVIARRKFHVLRFGDGIPQIENKGFAIELVDQFLDTGVFDDLALQAPGRD